MIRLIDASFIRSIRPELSGQVIDNDPKILTYIDDAQLKDVRPLFTYEFWKVITGGVGDGGVIDDLLNGGDYEYSGNTYENPGLKDVIARYTYARYSMFGHKMDTRYGGIVKTNQDARETSYQEKKDTYNDNRLTGWSQWELVREFLSRKSSDYPFWSPGVQNVSVRARIIRKR
ncbi:DUF6712 family protein [Ekhidna sp.]